MPSTPQFAAPAALTIAGFDPSSGAGITADLAVFAAHGIFGTSAITALTVQSTAGVQRVQPIEADVLADTLKCLQDDLPPAGVKIGMLGGAAQVSAVAEYLSSLPRDLPVVLDPVLQSTSGVALLSDEGRNELLKNLLPRVTVVTPNAIELSILTGASCETEAEIQAAARRLAGLYPGLTVLCTGGDRPRPNDFLLYEDSWTVLPGAHIASRATHGTGCALSSALLCGLLSELEMHDAAVEAKAYVTRAIVQATPRGSGKGPMNLLWPLVERT